MNPPHRRCARAYGDWRSASRWPKRKLTKASEIVKNAAAPRWMCATVGSELPAGVSGWPARSRQVGKSATPGGQRRR
jgi:hypothetical protein